MDNRFVDIIHIIHRSKNKALKAVNTELINLYWNIGEYISEKIALADWGDAVVAELAKYIAHNEPEIKGFSAQNIWRMLQFYDAYKDYPKLSAVLREISWTHNLAVFSRCKSVEEREFYLKMAVKERYSYRELDRQISASLFERSIIGNKKVSTALRESSAEIKNTFKDSYVFEFLDLPEIHTESDLKKGLVSQMKRFILELGKDFLFIGEEHKLQVGNSDFYIDLLFYHRGLQCLVAFELKADKFKPEHLGQINFYLEALDRNVKKEHENPSIGILLCKDKDTEVVKYALSRSLSTAMVADYKTQLPDKKILQKKLQEIFEQREDGE